MGLHYTFCAIQYIVNEAHVCKMWLTDCGTGTHTQNAFIPLKRVEIYKNGIEFGRNVYNISGNSKRMKIHLFKSINIKSIVCRKVSVKVHLD